MFSELATLTAAAVATAGGGPATEYRFALSSQAPATATGLAVEIRYGDQDAKAPGVERLSLSLPPGMRINTAAVPRCTATDDDIRRAGLGACPADSRVGAGTLLATTGLPGVDPLHTDVHVFNGDNELIEIVTAPDTDAVLASDRLKLVAGRLVAHPPAPPGGPPDNRTTVREVAIAIDSRSGYMTTPARCPGSWSSTAEVRYAAHEAPVLVTAQTPCARPAIRLRVQPHELPAGKRARLRVRVDSDSAACREGVRIALGGRRWLTSARGRAATTVRFARPGRRRLRAAKPGCLPARAVVRVV